MDHSLLIELDRLLKLFDLQCGPYSNGEQRALDTVMGLVGLEVHKARVKGAMTV